MVRKKPVGLIIIASLITFIGGLTTLVIFLEMVDSLRLYGFKSVYVTNVVALFGFFVYGGIPILLYTTGLGLFTSRPWARYSVLFCVPFLLFFYFMNLGCHLGQGTTSSYSVICYDVLLTRFDIFSRILLFYGCVVGPLIWYFRRENIRDYFKEVS